MSRIAKSKSTSILSGDEIPVKNKKQQRKSIMIEKNT